MDWINCKHLLKVGQQAIRKKCNRASERAKERKRERERERESGGARGRIQASLLLQAQCSTFINTIYYNRRTGEFKTRRCFTSTFLLRRFVSFHERKEMTASGFANRVSLTKEKKSIGHVCLSVLFSFFSFFCFFFLSFFLFLFLDKLVNILTL